MGWNEQSVRWSIYQATMFAKTDVRIVNPELRAQIIRLLAIRDRTLESLNRAVLLRGIRGTLRSLLA
jgi:hypothetical protein